MTQLTPPRPHLRQHGGLTDSAASNAKAQAEPLVALTADLQVQRRVRALAHAGSFGTAQAWAGSAARLLCFARGLEGIRHEWTVGGLHVTHLPFEPLERARSWPEALAEAQAQQLPLGLVATCRPVYDPAGQLARVQRTLRGLEAGEWAAWRAWQVSRAERELVCLSASLGARAGAAAHFRVAGEVRRTVLTRLYPALLTRQGAGMVDIWADTEATLHSARTPHHWRTRLELGQPRASELLGQLYGFGGQTEAEATLRAARGLGLEDATALVRTALGAGYADGAVRLMRDAGYSAYAAALAEWPNFSPRKQAKLSAVLGLERVPLGAGALSLGRELLELARE